MHFLLIYDYTPDYMERRAAFRTEHLAYANTSVDRGELVLGGALADPPDKGVLLFRSETPETAAGFARNDPYVVNGLVSSWKVRPWTTVVGKLAEHQAR